MRRWGMAGARHHRTRYLHSCGKIAEPDSRRNVDRIRDLLRASPSAAIPRSSRRILLRVPRHARPANDPPEPKAKSGAASSAAKTRFHKTKFQDDSFGRQKDSPIDCKVNEIASEGVRESCGGRRRIG